MDGSSRRGGATIGVVAVTVADLADLSTSATSPNESPGPRVLTAFPCTVTDASPLPTMKKLRPSTPSVAIAAPTSKRRSTKSPRGVATVLSSRSAKSGTPRMSSAEGWAMSGLYSARASVLCPRPAPRSCLRCLERAAQSRSSSRPPCDRLVDRDVAALELPDDLLELRRSSSKLLAPSDPRRSYPHLLDRRRQAARRELDLESAPRPCRRGVAQGLATRANDRVAAGERRRGDSAWRRAAAWSRATRRRSRTSSGAARSRSRVRARRSRQRARACRTAASMRPRLRSNPSFNSARSARRVLQRWASTPEHPPRGHRAACPARGRRRRGDSARGRLRRHGRRSPR